MKKILTGILLAAAVCSCEMDLFRSDTMTSTQLKSDPSSAVYTTDGNYSMFKDILMYNSSINPNNTYIRHWFQMAEFRGDNVTLSGRTEDPLYDAIAYADIPTSYNLGYFWYVSYKIIYGANSNIEAIQEGASVTSDQLLGENYFLRAVCHLNLLQLYARPYSRGRDNLGVVLRNSTDCSETKRATVGEVYEQIEKDLKKAADLMKAGNARGDKGYVSHEAALGLLSRVYLHMGMNDECIAVCDELLGSDPSAHLDTDLDNYFANARTSKETLWCIANDENYDGYTRKGQIGSMYYSPDGIGSTGWCEMYFSDPLIELFNHFPEDKRLAAYFELCSPINDGKVAIHWPVNDGLPYRANALVTDVTPNGDGTYNISYLNKNYVVKNKQVNGFTEYYIEGFATDAVDDDDFTGGTRVFVRPNMSKGQSVRNTYPAYMMKKFTGENGIPLFSSPVMIRYAEVVLNRAEAYAHKGDAAKALADVNIIRKRAGLTGDAEMTQANMGARGYSDVLDVVLDERRLELCFEGFRPYDLYRNGRSINRKFAGVQTWETLDVAALDNVYPYCIPIDEINVSGIEQNR